MHKRITRLLVVLLFAVAALLGSVALHTQVHAASAHRAHVATDPPGGNEETNGYPYCDIPQFWMYTAPPRFAEDALEIKCTPESDTFVTSTQVNLGYDYCQHIDPFTNRCTQWSGVIAQGSCWSSGSDNLCQEQIVNPPIETLLRAVVSATGNFSDGDAVAYVNMVTPVNGVWCC